MTALRAWWLAAAVALGAWTSAPLLAQVARPVAGPDTRLATLDTRLARLDALLATLDELVERGDVAGYLARFEPDHPGAVAVRGRHLERLVAASARRTCKTSVHNGPNRIGDRLVVRLRHQLELVAEDGVTRALVEDTYLALREADGALREADGALREADGALVPTLAVEIPAEQACVWTSQYRCPPCNYAVGGVPGWLCVPLRREQALSLESASFFKVGSDVALELHVQVPDEESSAAAAARKLAEAFAEVEPSAQVDTVRAWTPARYAEAPLAGLDSASVDVLLPLDSRDRGGRRVTFYVVAFGGLQHVLMLRGSSAALAEQRPAIDALIQSYALVAADRELVEAASRALRHHIGGTFDGARYHNPRYGVSFDGPAGWRPEHRVGGARFRVRWTGPDGSQLWLVAYGVPAGVGAWTEATADRWIAWRCARSQLVAASEQPADLDDTWREASDGAQQRSVLLRCERPAAPTTPRRRILHVMRYDDLLLILDGYGRDERSEQAILKALPRLLRAR